MPHNQTKEREEVKLTKKDFRWYENGKEIWFYIGKKQYSVPDDICESLRLTAISEFKKELRDFVDPNPQP
jgi:hypothetical protein